MQLAGVPRRSRYRCRSGHSTWVSVDRRWRADGLQRSRANGRRVIGNTCNFQHGFAPGDQKLRQRAGIHASPQPVEPVRGIREAGRQRAGVGFRVTQRRSNSQMLVSDRAGVRQSRATPCCRLRAAVASPIEVVAQPQYAGWPRPPDSLPSQKAVKGLLVGARVPDAGSPPVPAAGSAPVGRWKTMPSLPFAPSWSWSSSPATSAAPALGAASAAASGLPDRRAIGGAKRERRDAFEHVLRQLAELLQRRPRRVLRGRSRRASRRSVVLLCQRTGCAAHARTSLNQRSSDAAVDQRDCGGRGSACGPGRRSRPASFAMKPRLRSDEQQQLPGCVHVLAQRRRGRRRPAPGPLLAAPASWPAVCVSLSLDAQHPEVQWGSSCSAPRYISFITLMLAVRADDPGPGPRRALSRARCVKRGGCAASATSRCAAIRDSTAGRLGFGRPW